MLGLFSLLNPGRWMLYAAALAALVAGYFAWAAHERGVGAAPYIAAIEKQKVEAAVTLKVLTEQVQVKEKALNDFTNSRNENDATNEGAIAVLADRLHASRLRDPNQTGCSGAAPGPQAAASAAVGGGNAAEAGGLLSAELSGLLTRLTREADTVNAAYISCRADAYEVRK
jgi:hypothetical protein